MNKTFTDIQFRNQVFADDKISVRNIALSSGFFREDEVEVVEGLLDEVLVKGEASGYSFIFAVIKESIKGFACFGPIPCTIGSYDLYWIAVDEKSRDQGIGKKILAEVEKAVEAMKGRQLYIETSSTLKYEPTRKFYLNTGYTEVARLADFYQPGDDKIVFVKKF